MKRKSLVKKQLSPKQIGNIRAMLYNYVESIDNPNINDFIAKNKYAGKPLSKKVVEETIAFSEVLEYMSVKEEAWLIEQKKEIPMAIFRLKQPKFGYIDTPQNKTEVNVTFTNSIPRPKRKVIDSN
jgi:hypothetical protein